MRGTRISILWAVTVLTLAAIALPVHAGEDPGDLFIKNTRQLTYEGRRAGEGYFSPDGRYLIFQSERDKENPFYQIFMLDFETGDVHRVSPGTGKTTCSFFRPGADEVMFASTHLDPDAVQKQKDEIEFRASGESRRYAWDYDEHFDVFTSARDGSGVKRLTDALGYDAEGGYSPDGKKIVFSSMRDAYSGELSKEDKERMEIDPSYFAEIYIMNADGSDQVRLTEWPGYDGGPFFTPDGERIVWRHFAEDGAIADVYTMKLDGSDRHRLTHFESMCWAPYFHPSGDYVIFTTNKQGFANFELYLVDAKGTKEPVRVTHTDGFDGLPVFSPDGDRIAWTSNRTPNKMSQLFFADWNHAAALEAVKAAPKRPAGKDEAMHGVTGREAVAGYGKSEFDAAISPDDLGRMVVALSDENKAGAYIARYFESLGLEPLAGDGTFSREDGSVIAYLPPEGNRTDASVLVIGARYGRSTGGYHGDGEIDASGPATMMELAAAMTAKYAATPDHFGNGVLFAAWSGGEKEGSIHFVENPPLALERIAAYVSLGTVGHLRDNTLLVQGAGSSESWRGVLERRNIPAGFNLTLDDTHRLSADVDAFYSKEVPIIAISAGGSHGESTDDALDVDGMARIGKLALAVIGDVAGAEEPMGWTNMMPDDNVHASARPYLGTIPDYHGGDGEMTGVKITGVTPGSPAEKAGLTGGDIIVEFGGTTIETIYDYSNALDAVKVGKPVQVVVVRGGERVEITVIPEARK